MFYYLKTHVGTWLIGRRSNGTYDLRMYFPNRGYKVIGNYQCSEFARNDVETYCTGFDLWDLKLIQIDFAGLSSVLKWSTSRSQPDLESIHA